MHDVVVIGAGPGGNIAALNLSNMGYKVIVLDWRHNIGDKLCTGIIGAECAERFPPNSEHVYREASAATVVSPSGAKYRIAGNTTQALIIDRVSYVDSLAQRAASAGADYQLGPRVENIEVSDRSVSVSTIGPAGQHCHRAEMAIIASGFGSPLLKMVGLRNGRRSDYMVGAQATVIAEDLEDTQVYLGEHIAPGSFGWLVPLADSRALMGIVSRHRLNGHMDMLLSHAKLNGNVNEIIEKPRRWGIPLKPLPRTYGDRVLVVGDAAGLVKPTTGGGIYYALLSGEIAAETASKALDAGDYSTRKLSEYQRRWSSIFGKELRTGYYARVLFESMGDSQLELLLDRFASREVQDELLNRGDFSFDWHSKVILKTVNHRDLSPLIRSFGPVVTRFLMRLLRGAFF